MDNNPDAYLNEIATHFGVSIGCISMALKRLKITRKKKSTLYKERDEEKRLVFIEIVEQLDKDKLVYIDESGVDSYVSRESGWAKRGKEVFGDVSGKRYARESFVAGILGKKVISPMCYTGTMATSLFNLWVKDFLLPSLGSGFTIIMDNATFHKSDKTKKLIIESGNKLFFLATYSPDLNPIEKFWANLKKAIRKCINGFNSLADAIDHCFCIDHL